MECFKAENESLQRRLEECNQAFLNVVGKNRDAMLIVDMDGIKFKDVNDSYGHNVGDKLLIHVAIVLKSCVRESETICRLGGDEFTVILEGVEDVSHAQKVATRIVEEMKKPLTIDGHSLLVSVSIGIAIFPDHGSNLQELTHNADKAMYKAKNKRSGCSHISYVTKLT